MRRCNWESPTLRKNAKTHSTKASVGNTRAELLVCLDRIASVKTPVDIEAEDVGVLRRSLAQTANSLDSNRRHILMHRDALGRLGACVCGSVPSSEWQIDPKVTVSVLQLFTAIALAPSVPYVRDNATPGTPKAREKTLHGTTRPTSTGILDVGDALTECGVVEPAVTLMEQTDSINKAFPDSVSLAAQEFIAAYISIGPRYRDALLRAGLGNIMLRAVRSASEAGDTARTATGVSKALVGKGGVPNLPIAPSPLLGVYIRRCIAFADMLPSMASCDTPVDDSLLSHLVLPTLSMLHCPSLPKKDRLSLSRGCLSALSFWTYHAEESADKAHTPRGRCAFMKLVKATPAPRDGPTPSAMLCEGLMACVQVPDLSELAHVSINNLIALGHAPLFGTRHCAAGSVVETLSFSGLVHALVPGTHTPTKLTKGARAQRVGSVTSALDTHTHNLCVPLAAKVAPYAASVLSELSLASEWPMHMGLAASAAESLLAVGDTTACLAYVSDPSLPSALKKVAGVLASRPIVLKIERHSELLTQLGRLVDCLGQMQHREEGGKEDMCKGGRKVWGSVLVRPLVTYASKVGGQTGSRALTIVRHLGQWV
ncbi:hypothetical protein KIPB_002773 [Kipferlia bialata]|uniref:Uncharacterized protein n=1 Tax=Kipferlia bialata TaxID=797122 RepID=A0A9K3GGH2_9EUKA|nr:hypothetical protein KIPB_002773 [Kipferlia bialata]|eukprot:g2773.t1